MNTASQWTTIGWMVLCGVCMGIAFDWYRVISHRFRLPRWLLPVLDLIYWTTATIVVYEVLRRYNHGQVRLYVFLGLGIGVTGYLAFASRWVVRLTGMLLTGVQRMINGIWKMFRVLLVAPVMFMVKILARTLDMLFVVAAALVLWVARLVLIPLKPIGRFAWARMLPIRKQAKLLQNRATLILRKIKAAWQAFRGKM